MTACKDQPLQELNMLLFFAKTSIIPKGITEIKRWNKRDKMLNTNHTIACPSCIGIWSAALVTLQHPLSTSVTVAYANLRNGIHATNKFTTSLRFFNNLSDESLSFPIKKLYFLVERRLF